MLRPMQFEPAPPRHQYVSAFDFWCFYKLHMYFDTKVAKYTMHSINCYHNRKYHLLIISKLYKVELV